MTAAKCARKLFQVVQPRARVHAEFFRAERAESGATVERDAIRVRTVFALRFGQSARTTASTSARTPLVHLNLPGNPVDLEQREGRIHRYKGHAVRRNVAAAHADDAVPRSSCCEEQG